MTFNPIVQLLFNQGIGKLALGFSGELFGETTFSSLPAQRMYTYIAEAVRIMMAYGTSQRSFVLLLWVGLRDWETSSAWTRGKVTSLYFHSDRPRGTHVNIVRFYSLPRATGRHVDSRFLVSLLSSTRAPSRVKAAELTLVLLFRRFSAAKPTT